jgi:signal transduction histidine kinase
MESIELQKKLDNIKNVILNKVLVIVLFVQFLGVTISVLRISQTGFKPIYGIQMFLALVIVLLFIFQKRFSTKFNGAVFLGALYVLAITGLASWGLYGFGYIYFIPATAVAFLYFSKRTGWILALLSLIVVIAIGFLFKIEVLGFYPGSIEYMQSTPMWLNMTTNLFFVGIVITLFWNNLFSMLVTTNLTISDQQNELKKINEELNIAKVKAEQSDRLKSAFLANISHEIRTPLNIIIGFSQMVAETDDTNERMELNKTIRENCDLMLKLVNDIVDFAKIESNSLHLNNTRFNLNEVLNDIEMLLGNAVPDGVSLNIEKPDQMIYADKGRLNQVLLNLVHNAIKYTPTGSINLKVNVDNQTVNFELADTGIGIDPSEHEKIFNRFYKIDAFCQGAGLGLCLCKWILKLMGGDISVSSELGKGSIFRFSLPIEASREKKLHEHKQLKKE